MSCHAVKGVCGALALLTCLAGGCSSSSVVGEWRDESLARGPYRKILVIALGKRPDVRRTYEDAFARELRQRGAEAVAGYTLLPSTTDTVDRAALGKAVADSGADAVIITRLLKMEKRVVAAPASYGPPSSSLSGYHAAAWSGYYEPAGISGGGLQAYEETIATLETSLFDARTQRVVWSATTETFEADAAQRQIPGLVKTLTGAMVKAKVVA